MAPPKASMEPTDHQLRSGATPAAETAQHWRGASQSACWHPQSPWRRSEETPRCPRSRPAPSVGPPAGTRPARRCSPGRGRRGRGGWPGRRGARPPPAPRLPTAPSSPSVSPGPQRRCYPPRRSRATRSRRGPTAAACAWRSAAPRAGPGRSRRSAPRAPGSRATACRAGVAGTPCRSGRRRGGRSACTRVARQALGQPPHPPAPPP
mmetsp:Transcript_91971/g.268996  ORF Transcript_91971/g.268996 Transcript_91971/m.268996 type:complete len:207 (-) Transcript_91971:276-896(-)